MKKKIFLLISVIILSSAYKRIDSFCINATTNATTHNLLGTEYLRERNYYAAIEEFKIAISLNSNTQASAVYYNNLGEAYLKLGFATYAEDCFKRALNLYGLNFKYYQNLATCYKKMRKANTMIAKYRVSKQPLDKIMLGLLYIENGNTKKGIITLDDFCISEPALLITPAVQQYLKEITK